MDYDTYSANDAIGKVYIDLNPLLWPSTPSQPVKKDSTDGSSSKEDNNKHPGNGNNNSLQSGLVIILHSQKEPGLEMSGFRVFCE